MTMSLAVVREKPMKTTDKVGGSLFKGGYQEWHSR